MSNRISSDIFILTARDLQAREDAAYQRGVARGRFEAANTKQRVARNCNNWKDGYCDTCGAQSQSFEVHADFECPHFQPTGGSNG